MTDELAVNATLPEPPAWPMGLRVTCSAAPLQIEGWVDGGYVYCRVRSSWDYKRLCTVGAT